VKKILISLMTLVVVAGMIGGGAFAYFSDTETSTGNTFTAGTLDLKIDADPLPGTPDWVDDPNVPNVNDLAVLLGIEDTVNKMKPGDTDGIIIGIKNAGSIDGIADLHIKNVVNKDNGCTEPEADVPDCSCGPDDGGELGANVLVTILYNGAPVSYEASGDPVLADTPLDDLECNNIILGALDANATGAITMTFTIPGTVGNIIQSDSVEFDVEFSLDQVQP